MNECTHIGLDVHKDTIAVAVLRPGTTEVDERVAPNTPEAIRRLLARHDPGLTALCYEAGPTGYDTHRLITSLGFDCDVIAPSMIPRRSGARVKTDRRVARQRIRSFLLRHGKRYPGSA
jgi:transposase